MTDRHGTTLVYEHYRVPGGDGMELVATFKHPADAEAFLRAIGNGIAGPRRMIPCLGTRSGP